MTKNQALRHFGSQAALAEALGIRAQSIQQWGDRPPWVRQQQLEEVTGGKLKADPAPWRQTGDEHAA